MPGLILNIMKFVKLASHTAINLDHVKEIKIKVTSSKEHYIDFVLDVNHVKSYHAGDKNNAFAILNEVIDFIDSDQNIFDL